MSHCVAIDRYAYVCELYTEKYSKYLNPYSFYKIKTGKIANWNDNIANGLEKIIRKTIQIFMWQLYKV